jgi:alanyl-tRNA synthetase
MGFERLVRAVQGKSSNYDTDVFMPIIERIAQITGVPYGKSEPTDIAIRVLADHIRAIVFTINDGQLPSNNGAGYVVRRILRRAVRYAFSTLQYKQPILFQLVPTVAAQFTDIFPEVQANQSFLQRVILEEENSSSAHLRKRFAQSSPNRRATQSPKQHTYRRQYGV